MALVLGLALPKTQPAPSVAAIASAASELKQQPAAPITPSGAKPISLASEQITSRLASMQSALLQANPDITNDLHFIHRAILDDPSQVTMLTEEQKITFFAGLMHKTGVEIIATVSRSKQASSKKLAALSVDDLL